MNQTNLVKNQNQMTKQTTPAIVWIVASIMFHLLILLLIMTYKFNIFEQEIPQKIRPDDHVVMYQPQSAPAPQPVPVQPEPKQKTKESVKPEPEQDTTKKMPVIIAGKQGVDEQNLDGVQHSVQYPKDSMQQPKEAPTHEPKQLENRQEQTLKKNTPLYKTTPLTLPKGNMFVTSIPQNPKELSPQEQSLENQPPISKNMYQHVPKPTKEIPIKTMSFKDIGLGANNNITTFGNSAHMGIQGDSPDIPTGEELKYITYLNQMANMIVNSMYANPQGKLIRSRTHEQVVFHVKVDRSGKLLTTRIINPSKHEIINIFILESVKQVGLFNPLPKFIKKDTFEINWRILM